MNSGVRCPGLVTSSAVASWRPSGVDTRASKCADCERLVRAFYGRALTDPTIGFIFTDVAHLDLEAHVPEITSFWETILLGAQLHLAVQ
jgi:hypothetical protein